MIYGILSSHFSWKEASEDQVRKVSTSLTRKKIPGNIDEINNVDFMLRYAPFFRLHSLSRAASVSVLSSCDCCASCVSCPRLLLFSACAQFLRLDAYPYCLAQGRTEKVWARSLCKNTCVSVSLIRSSHGSGASVDGAGNSQQ